MHHLLAFCSGALDVFTNLYGKIYERVTWTILHFVFRGTVAMYKLVILLYFWNEHWKIRCNKCYSQFRTH